MRFLSGLLIYLLTNIYISDAKGFWTQFKIKNGNIKKNSKMNKMNKMKEIQYEESTWDDGEVPWENMQEYKNENQTLVVIKKRPFANLYKTTPLYDAIEMDQTKIASISALVRTTYRETFNIDSVISEINNKFTGHYTNIPAEFVVISMLTGLAIIYNKTNETEKERLEKLYILTQPEDYYNKYKKMKRISMIAIIVLSCLTTKNVQPAE